MKKTRISDTANGVPKAGRNVWFDMVVDITQMASCPPTPWQRTVQLEFHLQLQNLVYLNQWKMSSVILGDYRAEQFHLLVTVTNRMEYIHEASCIECRLSFTCNERVIFYIAEYIKNKVQFATLSR